MDQLLRLNEETLKWHVLCQLLSSSVLERLLKTLYEVCPSFTADTPVVARLYQETEQACLDVVKNFILIGEANRLLQTSSSSAPTMPTKPRPVIDPHPMRRLAPKPLNQLFNKQDDARSLANQQGLENGDKQPNPAWVNQINQNIQLQLKQLNSQMSQNSPSSSSRMVTPSSTSPPSQVSAVTLQSLPVSMGLNPQIPATTGAFSQQSASSGAFSQLANSTGPISQIPSSTAHFSQLPASNGPFSQLPSSSCPLPPLTSHTPTPVSSLVSPMESSRMSPNTSSISPSNTSSSATQQNTPSNAKDKSLSSPEKNSVAQAENPTQSPTGQLTKNGAAKPGEVQKFEKQVSELKNYMDEVKALFDVFNDPSPKNKEAVNALSQAISVNSAVAQEMQNIIKPEPELSPQQFNPVQVPHYFPMEQLVKQHQELMENAAPPAAPLPTHTHPTTKGRSSKEKLNCKDCGQMFQYSYQMERHIATRHSYIKKIICDICKKTFGSPGALKRHHETIHQKIKRFTCEHCGKKFGRKDHMKFHISTVHTQKKEAIVDHSILDAAITNATVSTEVRKPDDPLDELKQRIRDMSENHARELSLQQQIQQQQIHQQQLQQHILAQQQQQQQQHQTIDLQSVINSINREILKTSAGSNVQPNGVQKSPDMNRSGEPQQHTQQQQLQQKQIKVENGTYHEESTQQMEVVMDEDSVQVDVMEEGSNAPDQSFTPSSQYKSADFTPSSQYNSADFTPSSQYNSADFTPSSQYNSADFTASSQYNSADVINDTSPTMTTAAPAAHVTVT